MSPLYPLIMGLAVGSGFWLSRRSQSRLLLTNVERLGIFLGAFCGAMLGAKLPFVLADWEGGLRGLAWFGDGKTIVFGMVGAYFGVVAAKWALDIHVPTGDTFVVPAAVSIGIGRWACLVGGCCYGVPTDLPWGVIFPHVDSLPRHPTQIYESIFHLLTALVLGALIRREVWRGQLAKFYIISYLVYRFASEFWRPEPLMQWGLTGYQWSALALIPLFALLWWYDRKAQTVLRAGGALPRKS